MDLAEQLLGEVLLIIVSAFIEQRMGADLFLSLWFINGLVGSWNEVFGLVGHSCCSFRESKFIHFEFIICLQHGQFLEVSRVSN
jgi:hypothetical protein